MSIHVFSSCVLTQEEAGKMQSRHTGLRGRIPRLFKDGTVTPGTTEQL